jgi:hypothetical protein
LNNSVSSTEELPQTKGFIIKTFESFPTVLMTTVVALLSGLAASFANNVWQGDVSYRNWQHQHDIEFATKAYWDKVALLRDVNAAYRDYILFDYKMDMEQRYRAMKQAMKAAYPNFNWSNVKFGIDISDQPDINDFQKLADLTSKVETVVSVIDIYFGQRVRQDASAFLHEIRNAPVSNPDPGPLIEKLKGINPTDPSVLMGAIGPMLLSAPVDVTAGPFRKFVDDMGEAIRTDRGAATSTPNPN